MKIPHVSDIVGIINKIAPLRFAEEWDNSGLQLGDNTAPAERIMVALDASRESVEAAASQSCTLLLTHHPLLFKPLKRLSRQDPTGEIVFRAIESGIAIVALHTNYDIVPGGVNDLLADRLGIVNVSPLQVTSLDELVKMAVFVPSGHETPLLETLSSFICRMGNYADCSFRVEGTGTFRPLDGSAPFIGTAGERAAVKESRIEIIIRRCDSDAAITAMKKIHPYEEPAFDLYPLLNRGEVYGLGRIGDLPEPLPLREFADTIKRCLKVPTVRCVGNPERRVKRVAVCGGSGMSLLKDARFKGADLLVTGDVKYHEAREAEARGIAVVDAGHFATERLMIDGLAASLERELAMNAYKAELFRFEGEREPFIYI